MITITNECNMELMKRYKDNYFDLAIVDPPYGIGFGAFNRTNKASDGTRIKADKYKNSDWDDGIPNEDYFKELLEFLKSKLFGVVITFLLYGIMAVKVLFIGIKETQYQTLQMVNLRGLLLIK